MSIHLSSFVQHRAAQDLCHDWWGQALVSGIEHRRRGEGATCALAESDDAGGIDIELARVRLQPGDASVHVFQGRRVGVLWGQTVVGREDLGLRLLGETRSIVVD